METGLNSKALGIAAAVISATVMLILGLLGNLGVYEEAVNMMAQWHLMFNLTPLGIIGGMIESAVISFILLYMFGLIYNKVAR
jgi:hypothetical protein